MNAAAFQSGWWNYNDTVSYDGLCIGGPTDLAPDYYDPGTNYVWASSGAFCPAGYVAVSTYDFLYCQIESTTPAPAVIPEKNRGCDCRDCIGNPINPAVGNKVQSETDYPKLGVSPLEFIRTYNSWRGPVKQSSYWQSSYDRSVVSPNKYPGALVYRPDGSIEFFRLINGKFVSGVDANSKLERLNDGSGKTLGWQYVLGDRVEDYDSIGRLIAISHESGITEMLTYSDGTVGGDGGYILDANGGETPYILPSGLLVRVTDSFNRKLKFGYDASRRLVKMTDPDGGLYVYGYDSVGNLISVKYPDNKIRAYIYNETLYTSGANLPYALTGVVDENNSRFATYRYDADGRAISTEHAGLVEKFSVGYSMDSNGNIVSSVVTDALNTSRAYTFLHILGVTKGDGISKSCPGCDVAATKTYDVNGNVNSRTDFSGGNTSYVYDLTRNLETSRTEASGTAEERVVTTTWHPDYRIPLTITEPGKVTTFSYDTSGNVLSQSVVSMP